LAIIVLIVSIETLASRKDINILVNLLGFIA